MFTMFLIRDNCKPPTYKNLLVWGSLFQASEKVPTSKNNFKGIESSHYQPGPYSPVEDDVVKYVDWYIERMKEGLMVAGEW